MAVLEAKDVTMRFGGLTAVDHFNLSLGNNELVGLIGPNGAGKTTIFNTLTGVYEPTEGDVLIEGKSILKKNPHQVVAMGAARTFQNIRLFKDLTTIENVEIAYNNFIKYNLAQGMFRLPKFWKEEKRAYDECRKLLDIFDMGEYEQTKAKNLPYGQQRKLEIARALASNPKVLMLDEPAAGMNPNETAELMETIHFIREKFDITVLLIEHDMQLVMGICERILVVDYGKTIAEGTPDEIKVNPDVIRAYLGD
ncbi:MULTISPECIES: ABC transporter ATP-binding protein [Eubacterium]|uniref:Amino acid/amide ABC transporter ATP-binding protein 1, HAAT family n=2 Tax=Eubacterium TaxID=1730 RepID=A0A1H4A4F7_9FIRM|nr:MULTISPECIES: ABC transporter ATP-binding protein [Eubacterium]MDD4691596.1 ABC transporter ATP-binding protein [Eubacterium aggregans]MEA5074290.1 ABC transporter ATP-binding protein [Eubacterium aggregans]SDX62180.1 amino acid/amide ABC transporter ATP-binding protein 1, HAAT family [Eubacterium barkeri]SEA30846.1 amino acid/amide ABC transporter ATP-binding protein 1, HAAT family [Eubacterium aggregans]